MNSHLIPLCGYGTTTVTGSIYSPEVVKLIVSCPQQALHVPLN